LKDATCKAATPTVVEALEADGFSCWIARRSLFG
jgi:hypothetical protein